MVLVFLRSQRLKPRATQNHGMVIEATTEDMDTEDMVGMDERNGLLTPSLKQLKPHFPDQDQMLKLSHIMVMDTAIHITDITGEERSGQLKQDLKHLQHQTLKLSHIMVMDMVMAIHITDITGEERSDPLKPDLQHLN
jgi:hypothetical protein